MICDVILTKDRDKYIARFRDWPEVVVVEDTREQAITRAAYCSFHKLVARVSMHRVSQSQTAHVE